MRKRFGIGFIVLLVFALLAAACSDDDSSDSSGSGDGDGYSYVNPGRLTVATSLPAPGFWDAEAPEDVSGGFEYALAQEIAKRLGLDGVDVVNVSFDSLVAGQAQDFDLALSQITITDEREEKVDFSTPYFDGDQGVMMRVGDAAPKTVEDAKKLQWGIQTGTTAEQIMEEIQPDSEPLTYQETTDMFAALQAGQIDAAMIDTTILLAQANQDGGKTFEVVGQFKTGEQYGILFPQGSKLRAKVDEILQELVDDGTVAELSAKWLEPEFGKDPTQVPVISTD